MKKILENKKAIIGWLVIIAIIIAIIFLKDSFHSFFRQSRDVSSELSTFTQEGEWEYYENEIFSAFFPQSPETFEQSELIPGTEISLTTSIYDATITPTLSYTITRTDLNPIAAFGPLDETALLEGGLQGMLVSGVSELVARDYVEVYGQQVLTYAVTTEEFNVQAQGRMFLKDNVLYQILAVAELGSGTEDVNRFIGSFAFVGE
jgi:hypothetical protein